MKNTIRRWSVILLSIMMVLSLAVPALAYKTIDNLDGPCELTVNSAYAGVTYKVYKVCTISANATFTPTGGFAKDAKISKTINTQIREAKRAAWESLVLSLTNWLALDGKNTAPTAIGTSGDSKKAVFSDLTPGLYLVCGETYKLENGYYVPTAFLVTLPGYDKTNGTWTYEVSANGKGKEDTDKDGTTLLQVLKVWDDDGSEDRPTKVTVRLLCRKLGSQDNFIVYDTVTLSADSLPEWGHVWQNLDKGYEWIIEEVDVPDGYVSSTSRNGVNYVITNKKDPEIEDLPDDDPPLEEFPNIPDIDIPDDPPPLAGPPSGNNNDNLTDIEDEDVPLASLPQTGMLWWPVPILAVSGMFLFILGWGLHRRQESDEE